MSLNDREEMEWAEMLATYEKAVAEALREIDRGRPQDAADVLRQAEHEVHTPVAWQQAYVDGDGGPLRPRGPISVLKWDRDNYRDCWRAEVEERVAAQKAVAKLRAVACRLPLTDLCEEHVEPWQRYYDNYKRVMEETEPYTLPVDHPAYPE